MGEIVLQEEKQQLLREISDSHLDWKRLRRINRNWDGGLTITTIVLTLFISVLGVEGILLDNNLRKALIGLSGGIVVAIQSIGNAFPVKQRAGGYKALESQARTIKSKLGYLHSNEDLKKNCLISGNSSTNWFLNLRRLIKPLMLKAYYVLFRSRL